MWPFIRKKPYTADELSLGGSERAAERIKRALGFGEIIHIAPAKFEGRFRMGPIRPPGDGVITNWYCHRAVRHGNRIYDKMTGPNGMEFDQYKLLFDDWDALAIRTVEDE